MARILQSITVMAAVLTSYSAAFSQPSKPSAVPPSPPSGSASTPAWVIYEALFEKVVGLEEFGDRIDAAGKPSKEIRATIKIEAGLSASEEAALKRIAADCHRRRADLSSKIKDQHAHLKGTKAAPIAAEIAERRQLESELRWMIVDHAQQLEKAFGPDRFQAFDAYVKRTIGPHVNYSRLVPQ